jgi:glycine/D-amino acid oxidase-like deaminating enzyme
VERDGGAEVVIVGGGVHGASAAFHLAEQGVDVLLIERADLAGGPTGRSSAVCRAYYTNPFLARVARESLDLLAAFADRTGGRDAGHVITGGIFLHGPDDVAAVTAAARALGEVGTTVDVLDVTAAADLFPRFSFDGLAVVAHEHGAGYADPVATTVGLAHRARDLGARLRQYTTVVRVEQGSGSGPHVLTLSDGSLVEAERLLLAAGPWTRPLAAQVGADLPLTVERHVVATFGWGSAPRIPHVFADVTQGYYAKPEQAGGLLCGPLTPEPAIDDPDVFEQRILDPESEQLAAGLVRRVPDLEGIEPRGGWASLYDVSPDWQPIIGEIAPQVFVDAGTSGHGFKLGPGLGREVAALVMGSPSPGLSDFSPERFAIGAQLAAGYGDSRILG